MDGMEIGVSGCQRIPASAAVPLDDAGFVLGAAVTLATGPSAAALPAGYYLARPQPDDLQRAGQPGEVVVEPEELAGEGPQLLGHGGAQDEAGVVHRHRRRRGRDPLTAEKRDWLFHAVHYAGG